MKTAPLVLDTVSRSANLSPVFAANARAASSCDSPNRLMPSACTSLSFGHVVEVFCTQNDTSGGSSDTGTNVLAAKPSRTPLISAAIAMMPEGKWPKASRREVGVSLSGRFTGLHSRRRNFVVLTLPAGRYNLCAARHVSVGGCNVRMCAQPALPGIAAIHREDRI